MTLMENVVLCKSFYSVLLLADPLADRNAVGILDCPGNHSTYTTH